MFISAGGIGEKSCVLAISCYEVWLYNTSNLQTKLMNSMLKFPEIQTLHYRNPLYC